MNLEKYRLTEKQIDNATPTRKEVMKFKDTLTSDRVEDWDSMSDVERILTAFSILASTRTANAQLEAVKPAIEEADAKWVAVLKKYKVTVDSPESLAVAVDVLIEEAYNKGYRDCMKFRDEGWLPHSDANNDKEGE